MVKCPKCGSMHVGGPSYDAVLDMLRYRCLRCGYSKSRPPMDASRSMTAEQEEIAAAFERQRRALGINNHHRKPSARREEGTACWR